MEKIVIKGGASLKGRLKVNGSKNAALPIMAAALLTDEPVIIEQTPDLRDIRTMNHILEALGVAVQRMENKALSLHVQDESECTAPYERVKTMRGSFCVLGPLLAKRGKAVVSLPGGCVIGSRPVDLHIKGLEALGAQLRIEHGDIHATCNQLIGTEIYLAGHQGSSVLATCNVMSAAALAKGTTVIEGAACEPEVSDLALLLNSMGAKVRGAGSHCIEINGVEALHGTTHRLIPDRIEAGTFLVASILTGGDLVVEGVDLSHLTAAVDTLRQMGIRMRKEGNGIRVERTRDLQPVDVTMLPYPGMPTDLQAMFMTLLAVTNGISVITERVFPDRFMHIAELNRMGARIRKEGSQAIIQGVRELSGAPVMASDLRASACLVLAGLIASGTTEISRAYHIDRGYERIDEKLAAVGADITRENE